ncbi:MAG: AMP-binding protein, partial [Verrucomicrobiales bacterium]|nr:AMP-binding protein [Verrucomicrobiales bacterium]
MMPTWVEREPGPGESEERALERFLEEDRLAGFDLSRAPLWRLSLVRLRGHRWAVWTVHEALADTTSLAEVLADLGSVQGGSSVCVGDSSTRGWEAAGLGAGPSEEADRRWRAYLDGCVRGQAMPGRRLGPVVPDGSVASTMSGRYRWERRWRRLPGGVSEALRTVAHRGGLRMRTLVEAAWGIVLQRCGMEEDVLFLASRDLRPAGARSETRGQHSAVVPVRIVVRPERSTGEWLQELERQARHLEPFAGVGLDAIRRWSDLPRVGPVSDILVHYEEESLGNRVRAFGGRAFGQEPSLREQTGLPFTLTARDGDEFRIELAYDAREFGARMADRVLGWWESVLTALAGDPGGRVGDVAWLSDEEARTEWARGCGRCVEVLGSSRVDVRVAEQAARTPDVVAVVQGRETLTYAELMERSGEIARWLASRQVGPGDRVAICCERSVEMVVGVLGVLRSGAAYVPLDPFYPEARLALMLEESAPRALLTRRRWATRLPAEGVATLCLEGPVSEFAGLSGEGEIPAAPEASEAGGGPSEDGLAYVIYTSGSTGRPKGVAMGHRPLANLLAWQQSTMPLAVGTRVLQFSSLSFDVSFQELFSTWQAGGTLVLISEELRRDPVALLRYLASERIERIFLPFVALQQLAEASEAEAAGEGEAGGSVAPGPAVGRGTGFVREVITAGEQLQVTTAIRSLFRRWNGARLHNHYGPTESHVITSHTLTGDPSGWPDLPSIGRPIFN